MSDETPRPPDHVPPSGASPARSWPPPHPMAGGAPAPGWAPPVPARLPSFPHAEPTPYHQMLRTWTYAGWKPVVGILVSVMAMLLVMPLVLLPVLALGVYLQGGPFWEAFEKAATLQTVDPAALLYLNLVLGSMILVAWFVMRFVHRMRPRWLTSVVPKMRWRFLFICLGLAFVALIAQVLLSLMLPGTGEDDYGALNDFTRTTLAIAVIVILTTPFQAAGEEYIFRGYLLQAVGSMFRRAAAGMWVAIFVTALVFAAAHGSQNFPLFFDRFVFGLITGWVVVRTGGLEAAIALHIVNNVVALGFTLAFGDLTEALTISEASWWNIPLTLTQSGVFALLVVVVTRRMSLQTHTRPPVDELQHGRASVMV